MNYWMMNRRMKRKKKMMMNVNENRMKKLN
jgi:hypothetical protein